MKFSIGYNQDTKLLDLLDVYKDNIEALYFPIPERYLGTGRHIPQPKDYLNQVPKIITKCNSLNITSQLLLNATCEGKHGLSKSFFNKLISYIKKLKDTGLKSVVVVNPVYISKIKKEVSDIVIESSVNCYVKTVEQAVYLKDLGVDILCIDRDINRNIALIKEIKNKTGLKIRIMLNEGCLRNCPFRVMHYNYLSHRDEAKRTISGIFPDRFCIEIYLNNPAKAFSIPFIPPDALRYYIPFADFYKLSTRAFPTDRIELCLKAYINQKVNGNLLKILDCPGLSYFEYIDYNILKKNRFFEKMLNCNGACAQCGFCDYLLRKATVIERRFLKKENKGEERKTIRIYRNALKDTSPDKASIYAGLSRAHFNLKEYKDAIKLARKVIELSPREVNSYILLGSYYEKMEKGVQALGLYRRALNVFPSEGPLYLGLARVYFLLKKFRRAIKAINKVIALNCYGSGIYSLLGLCYERIGQYRKAIKEFKKEKKINPEDVQINFSLARCYRSRGQVRGANKELDKVVYRLKLTKIHKENEGNPV